MKLGIDFGTKRVGIALGEKIAISRGFFENDSKLLDRLVEIIKDEEVETVVIGLPLKDNGEEGELGVQIRDLADKIKRKVDIKIVFENESDSSSFANQQLKSASIDIKSSKSLVDGLAAAVILQQYIDGKP